MLRKLALLAIVAGAIGLGIFSFVTIPATVPASALGNRTPDLANGKEMFYAGGCTPATRRAGQDEVGGGSGSSRRSARLRAESRPIQTTASANGARRTSSPPCSRALTGRPPRLPGVSLHVVPEHARRGRARPVRAHQDAAGGARARVRDHERAVPVQRAAHAGRLEASCSSTASRSSPIRPSRAQWNRGAYLVNAPGPLRRVPFSPRNRARRHRQRSQRFRRRAQSRGRGLGAEHHAARDLQEYSDKDIAYLLETGDTPSGRLGRRRDGGGGAQHRAAVALRTAPPMAAYIKSLPPVDEPKRPEKKARKEGWETAGTCVPRDLRRVDTGLPQKTRTKHECWSASGFI